jgi:hypothetical protein
MQTLKTKSLQEVEQRMQGIDAKSLRYRILESVKNFKTSWIDLGQCLYTVWKDKMYKEWGYSSFDIYTAREIGIKKQTAMKLLRSYYFLEKEEPRYLNKDYSQATDAASVPSLESIDVLRLAKAKKALDEGDYVRIKKDIFEKGKEAREVRKDLTALIRQRRELEPEEAWEKRRLATIKRFLSVLKTLKNELEDAKLLSASLLKEVDDLIKKLEAVVS